MSYNYIMKLEIIALDKTVFQGVVSEVTVPGSQGRFQIFPDHAPLIGSLISGKIVYVEDGVTHEVDTKKGFIAINENEIVILDCA